MQVEVLMAVRDGARFLAPQLASIAAQRGVVLRIVASDDGSRDWTWAILSDFAAATGLLRLEQGPRRGAAANFLSLLSADPAAGYTALSDQDDIWFPGRLARACALLGDPDHPIPRLYASRTLLVDAAGRTLRRSRNLGRVPGFRNALLQNVLTGNTMVLNAAARELLRRTSYAARDVPFHDWWIYALLTGAGGEVIFDPKPGVAYRQHGANVIGAHHGISASARRVRAVIDGRYGDWLRRNAQALERAGTELTPQAREDLKRFARVFTARPMRRLQALLQSGARRTGCAGTCCVFGAAALGRL